MAETTWFRTWLRGKITITIKREIVNTPSIITAQSFKKRRRRGKAWQDWLTNTASDRGKVRCRNNDMFNLFCSGFIIECSRGRGIIIKRLILCRRLSRLRYSWGLRDRRIERAALQQWREAKNITVQSNRSWSIRQSQIFFHLKEWKRTTYSQTRLR